MAELAAIYARLAGSRIRSHLQYRLSFVMQVTGNLIVSSFDLLAILIFFQHVPAVGGWTLEEIAFLYGSSYVGFRLADAAVGHVEQLGTYIRSGQFDSFLLRPLGSLFQLLGADFALRQVGGLIQGLAVFVYAVSSLPIEWSVARGVMTVVMILSGATIFVGVFIATNAVAFWFVDTREIANAFTYGGNFVTQYPFHIFAGWLRRLFTVVVPVAFVNYYPALFVLGREGPPGMPRITPFLSPLVALALLAVTAVVWRAGLRRYQSTGS